MIRDVPETTGRPQTGPSSLRHRHPSLQRKHEPPDLFMNHSFIFQEAQTSGREESKERDRTRRVWSSEESRRRDHVATALKDTAWANLSDGGDLEEPVETRLLGRVVHVVDGERVWRKATRTDALRTNRQRAPLRGWKESTRYDPTLHPYLVGVLGLSTWSRFYRTPARLQTRETAVRRPVSI